jgi:hypothetical protein
MRSNGLGHPQSPNKPDFRPSRVFMAPPRSVCVRSCEIAPSSAVRSSAVPLYAFTHTEPTCVEETAPELWALAFAASAEPLCCCAATPSLFVDLCLNSLPAWRTRRISGYHDSTRTLTINPNPWESFNYRIQGIFERHTG